MTNFKEKANLIWGVADLLRGDYKKSDYGKIILPMTVLHHLDYSRSWNKTPGSWKKQYWRINHG